MIRLAVFFATALVFVTAGQTALTADKPKESPQALEKRLRGVWESGLDCVGDIVIRPDGTFDRLHYSPGNNTLSGTWEVRWNVLPPTLVLTCKTSDDADLAGKTREFKVVHLDDEALDLTDSMLPGGQPIRYTRVEKTVEQEPSWSKPINGLQARIELKETKVLNGTRILTAYLTLRNVSDVANSMTVKFDSSKLSVRVVDDTGAELSRPASVSYDGGRYLAESLVLPYDSSLTFNVSQSGLGIPKDKAALLDFGPEHCWIIDESDGKKYFLEAKLTVAESKVDDDRRYWHGTIEIPRAEIPLGK